MHCPRCDAELSRGAVVCGACGSSALAVPVSAQAEVVRVGLVLVIDAALVAAGLAFGLAWWHRHERAPVGPAAQPVISVASSAPKALASAGSSAAPTGPGRILVPKPTFVEGSHAPAPAAVSSSSKAKRAPDAGPRAAVASSAPPPPPPPPPPVPVAVSSPPPPLPPDAGAPSGPNDDTVSFSADNVRQVVNDHQDQIQACYARAAKSTSPTDPLQGTILVHITLEPSGTASDVHVVENGTGSDELGACLTQLLQGWKFPGPGKDAVPFDWPFLFEGH